MKRGINSIVFIALLAISFNFVPFLGSEMGAHAMVTENDEQMTICHIPEGNPANKQDLKINKNAWEAHETHGDFFGVCPPPPPAPYSSWCSILLGIAESPMSQSVYNNVVDINNDGAIDLTDTALISTLYGSMNDANCYANFVEAFTRDNYQQIDWCNGLKKGIQDSNGSRTGDPKYSDFFDLNNDGAINLSDIVLMVQLINAGDQAACYNHLVPPLPNMSSVDPEPTPQVHGEWCSSLLGIVGTAIDRGEYSDVADLNDDQAVNLSDVALVTTWYNNGNNVTCYAQFEDPENNWHFNWENYLHIDWCNAIKQGVTDSIGTASGDPRYSGIFDLNNDEVINLSDVALMSQLYHAGDRAVCYANFVPPLPVMVPPVELYCGDGIVNGEEECDGGEPVSCLTETGYAGSKSCNMPDLELSSLQSSEPIYCVYNPCVSQEYCGDGIVNGNEECDAGSDGSSTCSSQCAVIETPQPQPPSGGGGGGAYASLNIYNVKAVTGESSATISWQTSPNSITWMLYGLTTDMGTELKEADPNKANHSVALTDLKPNTTYYFQARAKSGSTVVYDIMRTFTTGKGGLEPQVLGTKEVAGKCVPKIDKDIKNQAKFKNGLLIRSCGPEVYFLVNGKRWHVPSWQYLHDHYFAKRIYNVSEEVLNSYPISLNK